MLIWSKCQLCHCVKNTTDLLLFIGVFCYRYYYQRCTVLKLLWSLCIFVRVQQERPAITAPSCVSMKSDQSMDPPLRFRDGVVSEQMWDIIVLQIHVMICWQYEAWPHHTVAINSCIPSYVLLLLCACWMYRCKLMFCPQSPTGAIKTVQDSAEFRSPWRLWDEPEGACWRTGEK